LLSLSLFQEKTTEKERKREKIYKVDTWKEVKTFQKAVTLHVFFILLLLY
jgi:hypothetical protein